MKQQLIVRQIWSDLRFNLLSSSLSYPHFFLKILIISFSLLYFPGISLAQLAKTQEKPVLSERKSIQWIGQFSSSKDLLKSDNISHRIFNFLFGSGEKSLIRPISLITLPDKRWIVMDQGNKNLTYVHREEGDFFNLSKNVLPSPVGICAASKDTIYFTDSYLNKIFYGKISDKTFEVLNDSIALERPTGIAYSSRRREIWVVETMAHRIKVLDKTGMILRQYGSRGTSPGEFNFPTFIWIDQDGLVYIVDSMNFRIQIMNLDGEILLYFGEVGDASGYFARPKGIATDSRGNIYVVDALFHTVQIFNREGQFLLNFGEQGREPGHFWLPVGIYIDADDVIYVADSYNSRIQIFQRVPGDMNEN